MSSERELFVLANPPNQNHLGVIFMFKSKWVIPATLSAALVVSAVPATALQAEAKVPTVKKVDVANTLKATSNYYYSLPDVSTPTYQSSDAVLNFARSNYAVSKDYYTTFYKDVERELKKQKGQFSGSPGALSKIILAITAIGKDPKNVAGYNLINLLGDKLVAGKAAKSLYITDYLYVLRALEAKDYSFPTGAKYADFSRKSMVDYLVSTQFENGGFSWAEDVENGVSVDMAAMVLSALANYDSDPAVKASIRKGLDYMSSQLTDVAGYSPWGGNSVDSQAQVVIALTENGINPKTARSFIKNGQWAVSNMLLNFDATTGGFKITPDQKSPQLFATTSAMLGLVAYDRYASDKNTFFDLTDAKASSLKYDTAAPKSLSVTKVANTTKTISGTTEPYATVTIYNGSKKLAAVQADAKGKFSYPVKTAFKANATVKFYVTDLASNKSKAITQKVADRLTPATPKVSKLVKGAKKVTGSTTKGATVYAKIGNKTYKATASTKTGSFSIKVPTLKEKTKVKVYAKKSNYTSKSVTVAVKSK